MSDVDLENGLASDFVKFLHSQLQETRDQLREKEETVLALRAEANALKKELAIARALAATRHAEIDTWRTRYEQLKPQLFGAAAHSSKLLDSMREELATLMPEDHAQSQSPDQFRAFMSALPASTVSSTHQSGTVVVRGNKLQLLSKVVINACVGGFCFFGEFQKWCPAPSQHGFVVFPEFQYNPKPTSGSESSWTRRTEWASLAGQQRELFYIDGENISYAGTFFIHGGPNGVKVDPTDEGVVQTLARKTFHSDSKNQKSKAKTYIPLLASLYREGSATVQLLGLQRIGFNEKLSDILTKAFQKRESRNVPVSDLLGMDADQTSPSTSASASGAQKRTIGHVDGSGSSEDAEDEERARQSPSKVRRLSEELSLFDF